MKNNSFVFSWSGWEYYITQAGKKKKKRFIVDSKNNKKLIREHVSEQEYNWALELWTKIGTKYEKVRTTGQRRG